MNGRGRVAALISTLCVLGGCVDYEVGADVVTGRAGIVVGLEVAGRGLPGSPAGLNVTGRLQGTATDSLLLVVANLPGLASGSYQVWLVDQVSLGTQRIGALHQIQRPDTVGTDPFTNQPIIQWQLEGSPQEVQSFPGVAGVRHNIIVKASDAAAAGAALPSFTHIVITIGEGGDASPLTSPAPAWYRYRNPALTGAAQYLLSQPVRYAFRPDPTWMNTPWTAVGGGYAEFLNTYGFGVLVNRGARPPLGFVYEVWLVNRTPGGHAPVSIGSLTSRPPALRPLDDADVTLIPDVVNQLELMEAIRWVTWEELGLYFKDFTHLEVVLRSKQSPPTLKPSTIVYEVVIPAILDRLPVEREPRIRDAQ